MKISISDSNSVSKVNNFFKWSEPGSTITDHFRTNCIFKLKKPQEENFEKIFTRINKEIYKQNVDLFSEIITPTNNLQMNFNSNNSKNNSNNEPCDKCDSCREITRGNSIDVLEIDAAFGFIEINKEPYRLNCF